MNGNDGIQLEERAEQIDRRDPSDPFSFTAARAFPELMTEEELIEYLRIPEVTKSTDYHNVIENLKRMHDLPRIHLCGKPLYPLKAVRDWVDRKTERGH